MVIVPPRHFVVVDNPVLRDKDGKEQYETYGQVKLRHGDSEVRFHSEPFALFPGEKLSGGVQPLHVVKENHALRLRAKRDFVDRYASVGEENVESKEKGGKVSKKGGKNNENEGENNEFLEELSAPSSSSTSGVKTIASSAKSAKSQSTSSGQVKRRAGEEWIFKGLATYYPQSEEEIVQSIQACVIKPNQALKLKAKDDCVDSEGKKRKAGEMWLVKKEGSYLPAVNEIDCGLVDAIVLTPTTALHLRANVSFKDTFSGVDRKSGEEWLITREQAETYIVDVNESLVRIVNLEVLNNRQWCIIQDPVDEATGQNRLGEQKYVRGPATFFLQPGERFSDSGYIQSVLVLSADRAVWVRAKEAFVDEKGKQRNAGDKWLVAGPGEYWLPRQASIERHASSFISIEALGFYIFQPVQFLLFLFVCFVIAFFGYKFLTKPKQTASSPKTDL